MASPRIRGLCLRPLLGMGIVTSKTRSRVFLVTCREKDASGAHLLCELRPGASLFRESCFCREELCVIR